MPWWWRWGYYVGFHAYSFEAFIWNEFHDDKTTVDNTNQTILELYEADDVDFGVNMTVLAAYTVAFQIILFFIIFFMHTGKL